MAASAPTRRRRCHVASGKGTRPRNAGRADLLSHVVYRRIAPATRPQHWPSPHPNARAARHLGHQGSVSELLGAPSVTGTVSDVRYVLFCCVHTPLPSGEIPTPRRGPGLARGDTAARHPPVSPPASQRRCRPRWSESWGMSTGSEHRRGEVPSPRRSGGPTKRRAPSSPQVVLVLDREFGRVDRARSASTGLRRENRFREFEGHVLSER